MINLSYLIWGCLWAAAVGVFVHGWVNDQPNFRITGGIALVVLLVAQGILY